ncbi:hypothetical protein GCM10010495_54860 [Kitasatospora herbaricolor]|nr:hypothetical protein GCM10010495_54860 [Kitasatospora herbaricolor]
MVGPTAAAVPGAPAPPGRATPSGEVPGAPTEWTGEHPWPAGGAPDPEGGVAHLYITPRCHWHTMWRTLAKPGECSLGT